MGVQDYRDNVCSARRLYRRLRHDAGGEGYHYGQREAILSYLWGNVPTRIDSLTGIVYQYKGGSSDCPDSTEIEYVNLTIDSTSSYTLCHGWEWEYYVATTDVPEQAGLLDVDRKQRVWTLHYYGTINKFARGSVCVT
jgi:hypothetical protein